MDSLKGPFFMREDWTDKMYKFGLTADVASAHLVGYCQANPAKTPADGVLDLMRIIRSLK